jgi:hypothetical protein
MREKEKTQNKEKTRNIHPVLNTQTSIFGLATPDIPVLLRSGRQITQNIQPVLNTQTSTFDFATPTIPALLRSDRQITRTISQQNANTNNPINTENEEQDKPKRSWFKKLLDSIYIWDNNFRFSVMIVSTYTIAAVFLFYLACTFVFLYLSRITTLIAFIKFYIQLSTNIGE